jgi:hypothetical protein
MRLGPFLLTRRAATRAIAGLVTTLLLTGNVLAAAGLCVVKSPDHAAAMQAAAGQVACPDHVPDIPELGSSGHLCPAEDPTPQTRSVDLPAPQLHAALTLSLAYPVQSVSALEPPVVAERPVPPPPLYARLQRLRL